MPAAQDGGLTAWASATVAAAERTSGHHLRPACEDRARAHAERQRHSVTNQTRAPSGVEPARGTAHRLVCERLSGLRAFEDFRAGRLSRSDFQHAVDGLRCDDWGLNEDQLNLATRFAHDGAATVRDMLTTLSHDGAIASPEYPEAEFDAYEAQVERRFVHGPNLTFIFPEEARFLFALAWIAAPQRTVFLGSYYGYWAIWAMPAIAAAGGHAVLIDPDAAVLELSRANMERFGYADRCTFVCADAAAHLHSTSDGYDLAVLDAEGPHDEGPPDRRAKAIYAPLTEAVTPRLRPHGLLVAHNVLLDNVTDNAYFRRSIARNRRQFERFLGYVARTYDVRRTFATSEGIGVYRRMAGELPGHDRRATP